MPTQIADLLFSTIPDGFSPTFPAGWVKKLPDQTRVLSGYFLRSTAGSTSAITFNTPFITNEMELSMLTHATGFVSTIISGVQFLDSNNNGYAMQLITSGLNFIVTINLVTNYTVGAQLFTNTFVRLGNEGATLYFRRIRTTGVMGVYLGGTQLGVNTTHNTYNPFYGSATSFGGSVRSITLTDLAAHGVNTFNGANTFTGTNTVERGQQDVVFATTGLGAITSITTDKPGITFSGIDNTGKTADASDYVEGGLFPVLPVSFVSTFSDGTLSAQITKNLTIKSTESAVVTANMITTSTNFIGKLLSDAGHSVANGGQIVWPTTPKFSINSDGSYSYDGAGDLELSFWYITPDTGRSYEFDAVFTSGGSGAGGNGITMAGITAAGVTMTGITAVGL